MFLANAANQPPVLPEPPTHQEWNIPTFQPGNLKQDIFTLPLEIGLIGSLNYFYNPRSKTLFPLADEATRESNNATKHTRSSLLPYAIGTGAFVFGGLTLCNDNFPTWTYARGLGHALLLSEVAVTAAKVTFQKKRPNYEAQVQFRNGEETNDARASFYSDHANQAFALTTYTSLMMFHFSNSLTASFIYSGAAYTAASIISYSRVTDHAHNLSDVIVGAIMGTTISGLTFFRVHTIDVEVNKKGPSSSANWNMSPGIIHDETGKTWYTADINLEI